MQYSLTLSSANGPRHYKYNTMLRFCPMTKVGNIRRDTTGPIGTFHTQTKFWEKNASTAHPLTRAHLYSINLYTSMNNI